jgi:NAD(P)-dependent dehydrogenase (short-subunit alcohol dehydrogenase family)
MARLERKIVLITGGTSGIGRVSALIFANEGAKVVLTGPRAAEGETVVAEIAGTDGEAMFVHADLSRRRWDCGHGGPDRRAIWPPGLRLHQCRDQRRRSAQHVDRQKAPADWSVQRSSSFDREPAKNADKIALAECLAMISRVCLLSMSSMLFITVAAAQTPPWPIVDGRHLQPTQHQVDSREHGHAGRRNVDLQSDVDRLYDEITRRASAATGASPLSMELEAGEAR